jgi:RNA polymerase sigma-70 factor (ECF subfamily)
VANVPPFPSSAGPESTIELLNRLQTGDSEALDRLFARYLVPLRRWAHGRLPQYPRGMSDTQDLVQDAVTQVLRQLAHFQPNGPGALHRYLRSAIMNRIRDELRRVHRRPIPTELDEDVRSEQASPLELAIGSEELEIFEAALEDLRDEDRELVIARVEWDLDYAEIASALGKPSVAAAGIAVRRALVKLAEAMQRHRTARSGDPAVKSDGGDPSSPPPDKSNAS